MSDDRLIFEAAAALGKKFSLDHVKSNPDYNWKTDSDTDIPPLLDMTLEDYAARSCMEHFVAGDGHRSMRSVTVMEAAEVIVPLVRAAIADAIVAIHTPIWRQTISSYFQACACGQMSYPCEIADRDAKVARGELK